MFRCNQRKPNSLTGCLQDTEQRSLGFPGGSEVKASASNAEDPGSIPGLGRSPGEGNGNPLQYSCLENPMDKGAWQATVPRGRKESDTTEQLHFSKGVRDNHRSTQTSSDKPLTNLVFELGE